MKTHILLAALLLGGAPGAGAQEAAAAAENSEIRGYYDKAFGYYVAGDYPKAIEHWSMVLRSDPKQTTARNMIEDARKKMAGTSADLKGALSKLLERGRYADALLKLEELLATDQTNPYYIKLQGRLRKIAALAPAKPSSSKGWNAASEGISAWLGEKEDLPFAFDALRYAAELAPLDKVFGRLIITLEEEAPQLKLNDTKPDNSGVLEHKKKMALDQIYDSKFYLAVKELEGVLRLEPNDITALKRAGSAYLQLKDYRRPGARGRRPSSFPPKIPSLRNTSTPSRPRPLKPAKINKRDRLLYSE